MKKYISALLAIFMTFALMSCAAEPSERSYTADETESRPKVGVETKMPLGEYLVAKSVETARLTALKADADYIFSIGGNDSILRYVEEYRDLAGREPSRVIMFTVPDTPELVKNLLSVIGEGGDTPDFSNELRADLLPRAATGVANAINRLFGDIPLAASLMTQTTRSYWSHKDFSGVYYVLLCYGEPENAMAIAVTLTAAPELPEVLNASATILFLPDEAREMLADGAPSVSFQQYLDLLGASYTVYEDGAGLAKD
ncbi:MAG: hypothetical protein LBT36_03375 [Oscillospiraceae bacterium]|jgi:hypothetical protein|nr:hypothetical protein [Oscillospiraceae bacterium]